MCTAKKQVGDRIMITAGQFKNETGKLTVKKPHGWTVELEDGQEVSVSFAMVALLPSTQEQEIEVEAQTESSIDNSTDDDDEHIPESEQSPQPEEQSNVVEGGSDSPEITKMTVKQLQALAKQRGIGIARTKSDFLRIIKKENPDEDLDQLVGKTLFNRVSELHISRLRTKEDLVRMLTESRI